MIQLYILFTTLIYPLTLIVPILSKKGKLFLQHRKNDRDRVSQLEIPNFDLRKPRIIWLHAASVGELDQCKAQAKSIKEAEPNTLIIQSVFSESVQEKNFDSEYTFFNFRLPLDFYFSYDFIFKKFQPECLVLMAWETWPNLILAASRFHCKVFLASAVYDPRSKRISFFAKALTKSIFQKMHGVATVNESMVPPFSQMVGNKIPVQFCGDSRFDSVVGKIESKKPNISFTEFAENYSSQKILLLASTYSSCDEILLPGLEEILDLGYAIWIFPHKIDTNRINEVSRNLENLSLNFCLYSNVKNPCKDRIILFDVLGILAFAYFYGKIAYVGGALHNKVHNVLEPAYFGLPLITGDKIFNSIDAINLNELKSLSIISSTKDFLEIVNKYSNKTIWEKANETNKNYVLSRTGASTKFYQTFLKQ